MLITSRKPNSSLLRFGRLILCFVFPAFVIGCSDTSSPRAFTAEYAEAVKKAVPGSEVIIVKDLELKVTRPGQKASIVSLDNAYLACKADPGARKEIIARYVASVVDIDNLANRELDRTRIVPVIKDRAWLEETAASMKAQAANLSTKMEERVFDEFAEGLVMVYAEDNPNAIRYISPGDLTKAKIARSELRSLAVSNLKRLLPDIERGGGNGIYMITAGGTYEASLLVMQSLWTDGKMKVAGDYVVSIPTRDLLLVTGSNDPDGIERIRKVAKDVSAEAAYTLTRQLFVYRNGKFEPFNEAKK